MNRAASPDGPYSSTSLGLQVSDTDGIGLSLSALNIDSTGDGTADSASRRYWIRHGRIRMEGGSAAPADTLSAIFRTEYFNGSDWSTMSIDNCTAIARSAVTYPDGAIDDGDNLNVTVGGGQTTGSYASMTSSQINFQSGDAGQTFSAPGAGNIGAFSVSASVSAQPWLQFDWDGDGQHDDASLPAVQYDFRVSSGATTGCCTGASSEPSPNSRASKCRSLRAGNTPVSQYVGKRVNLLEVCANGPFRGLGA